MKKIKVRDHDYKEREANAERKVLEAVSKKSIALKRKQRGDTSYYGK